MNTLVLAQDGDWVRLSGGIPAPFLEFIKYGIKPTTYRRYDSEKRNWLVHWKRLPAIAKIARSHFDRVDWSSLPEPWQMFAAGAQVSDQPILESKTANPYATLYVLDDAPMEVVRASFRALATLWHPDVGGSAEKMKELNVAFDAIKKLRSVD